MNLLPEIHSQLAGARRRSRGLSLLIVVVLMFAVSTTVFAIVSSQISDPGLEGARTNNLITDVNQTQTIDGVTVTLEWAYADAERIAFGYRVTAPEENIYYNTSDFRLYDEANSFSADSGGGGGGGGGSGRESQYVISYNIMLADDAPEELALHIDLTLTPMEQMELGINGYGGGSGGGGGSLGGGAAMSETAEVTPEIGASQPNVGPFQFAFTLRHYPAITVTPEQTVESNEVAITLKSLSVVPSMTAAEICYTLPDSRDWSPVFMLHAGNADTAVAGWGMSGLPSLEDTERCVMYEFYAPYDYTPTTFTLTASELRTSASFTPERAEVFRQMLDEQGVEVTITLANGEGFGYEITKQPDGDVGLLIQQAMDTAFSDHYTGDWAFTVEIPGLER